MTQSPIAERNVRLARTPNSLIVLPSGPTDNPVMPFPFPLPGFPMSQLVFLESMAHRYWMANHRCFAVALMLDVVHQKWVRPEIPTQKCHEQGASWTYSPEDFKDRPPQVLIGGSYQLANVAGVDEAMANVPPRDGLHLVQSVIGDPWLVYLILSSQGELEVTTPDKIMVDDWSEMLQAYRDRMIII